MPPRCTSFAPREPLAGNGSHAWGWRCMAAKPTGRRVRILQHAVAVAHGFALAAMADSLPVARTLSTCRCFRAQVKGNFMFDPAKHPDFLGAVLGTGKAPRVRTNGRPSGQCLPWALR